MTPAPPDTATTPPPPELLASYTEARLGFRCRYDLYADRIVLSSREGWSWDAVRSYPLAKLAPEYGTLRYRSVIAGPGALVLGCIFATLFVFGWLRGLPTFFPVGAMIDGGLAVASIVTGLRNLRKIEFYTFTFKSGEDAFRIARSGPQRDRFDAFVSQLIQAITQAGGRSDSTVSPA